MRVQTIANITKEGTLPPVMDISSTVDTLEEVSNSLPHSTMGVHLRHTLPTASSSHTAHILPLTPCLTRVSGHPSHSPCLQQLGCLTPEDHPHRSVDTPLPKVRLLQSCTDTMTINTHILLLTALDQEVTALDLHGPQDQYHVELPHPGDRPRLLPTWDPLHREENINSTTNELVCISVHCNFISIILEYLKLIL